MLDSQSGERARNPLRTFIEQPIARHLGDDRADAG